MATTKKTMPKKKAVAKSTATPSLGTMVDKDSSLSVRQIENGFLVSENGYEGKGKNKQWYNKEYFSPTNPVASVPKIKFGKK